LRNVLPLVARPAAGHLAPRRARVQADAARVRRRPRLLMLACAVAAVIPLGAAAQPDRARPPAPRSDTRPAGPEARSDVQWLQAIQSAAQRLNFAGTVVYQQGGEVRASRIVHLNEGGVSHERVQMLDGRPREFVRRDDEVMCLFPDARRVVWEKRLTADAFPAISNAPPAEVLERYSLKVGRIERAAGIDCQMLRLEPKDTLRYGYRICVDPTTGLLLKAQTVNDRHEVLEQMAFTDVRVGVAFDKSLVKPSWSTEGWTVDRADHKVVELAQFGWTIPLPQGFHKVREFARKIGVASGAPRKALHAVYSDGLATVSVFIEPGAGEAVAEAAQVQGPTSIYTRRVGDALVTVIGEAPPATVRTVAQSVEYKAPQR
jgi:sigma-E factor negative regulatory protein RseB